MGLFSRVLEGETFATMTLVFAFWDLRWVLPSGLLVGFSFLFAMDSSICSPKKRKKTLAFVEV